MWFCVVMNEEGKFVRSGSDPNFLFSTTGNSSPLKKLQKVHHQQQQDQQHQQEATEVMTTPSNSAQYNWQSAQSKRKRSPNYVQVQQKQRKLSDYWLAAPTTSNRFENLDKSEDMNTETEPKPPPIFVSGVENIAPLNMLLHSTAENNHTLKIIASDKVKIQATSAESYSKIVKALAEKSTHFHTYELKQNRAFRVVLKNMHPTTDIVELKEKLCEMGHIARHIHNIRHRGTKVPLPMFYVELEPNANNKDIYNIDAIMHLKVKFEPPHQKREIPQCTKCQRYGHTRRFCHHSPRCVKCAGEHLTATCQRKEKDRDVLCVLCNGNHSANYRGCTIYKQLQEKNFPKLRNKRADTNPTPINPSTARMVQPGISYAQIARENSQQTQFLNNVMQDQLNTNSQSQDMLELKHMMKSLMEQMGTMLNLLTTLVSKMK